MCLTEQAKEARREYQRKYYKAHKEQAKEANRRYWERKALKNDNSGTPAAESKGKE